MKLKTIESSQKRQEKNEEKKEPKLDLKK